VMNDNLVGEDTVNLVIGVNGGCVFAALFFFSKSESTAAEAPKQPSHTKQVKKTAKIT